MKIYAKDYKYKSINYINIILKDDDLSNIINMLIIKLNLTFYKNNNVFFYIHCFCFNIIKKMNILYYARKLIKINVVIFVVRNILLIPII